jgi:iron complex outermembrane receptor protein
MRNFDSRLVAGVTLTLSWIGCSGAQAQDADAGKGLADSVQEVVVTGTRRSDRTVENSPSPIDVIGGDALARQSFADMTDVLRTQVVSLNTQRFVTNDGAVLSRPFTLRGLPPDQTLVLMNGKRWHRGATIQFSRVPSSQGAQGVDIATIPTNAIKQVEVLRDGASAQYGSDAIAGVINFILKDASEGATIATRYGQFYEKDGQDTQVQGSVALPLTADGFLDVSGEYVRSRSTSRGVQRPDAQVLIDAGNTAVPVPAQRWGNPDAEAARAFFNSSIGLTDTTNIYAFGNYSWSTGDTEFFWRNPTNNSVLTTSVPLTSTPGGARFRWADAYPGGFTPLFGGTLRDSSLVAGLEGKATSNFSYDLSASYGRNEADYRITNTFNPSLGPTSPTSFHPGSLEQQETNVNFDTVYTWSLGWLASPLNVGSGLQYRREQYTVNLGEQAAWQVGPYARVLDPDSGRYVGLPVGSNGFPGYAPIQAGEFARSNWAAYVDLESDVTQRLSAGVAMRYEDFSDFGSTFNWKVSSRLELTDRVALRAAVNTGFRAPTPGQSNVTQVATNIDLATGQALTRGTLPSANPVAQFFGARPLKPEKSFNVAGGFVLRLPQNVLVTLDYFDIRVEDRISLSSDLPVSGTQRTHLVALGVPGGDNFDQINFFGNSFDSRTRGADLVATHSATLGGGLKLGTTLSVNYTDTKITQVSNPLALDRERRLDIEGITPALRGNLQFDAGRGPLNTLVRFNYYGKWTDYGTAADGSLDETLRAQWLVDLEAGYNFTERLRFTVGGENIFNAYPGKDKLQANRANGIVYPRFSPIGFNGGFWYARAVYSF